MKAKRTDPKLANNMFIFFFPAVNWLTSGLFKCNFVIKLAYVPFTNHSQKIKRTNKQGTQMLDKERCIKEQIYFELLYVGCIKVTS